MKGQRRPKGSPSAYFPDTVKPEGRHVIEDSRLRSDPPEDFIKCDCGWLGDSEGFPAHRKEAGRAAGSKGAER